MFAGHGYIVAIPEIYHEYEAPGTVLAYDQAGSDRGNVLKTTKPLVNFDTDARAVLDHLAARPDCTGKLGALGICIGGHLAFRAAFNPDVLATVCFYATDIHKGGLGLGTNDDSLARAADIKGEI
jgi:carboxymethylenebutenolidase